MLHVDVAVYLVVGVVIVNGLAARIGLPAPILLVVVGLAVSFIPGVPDFAVNPEFVLAVLIPPLLYAAAHEVSIAAFRRLIRPITQLAVGMVLITALAVAVVLTAIVPDMPFAAALALGAIVAPPDAVAAVAVARRAGLPRDVVSLLDGESLFNDATSLVLLRVAVAGIAAGSMAWGPAMGELAWATVGGALVGAALGVLITLVRRLTRSSLAITALSLVTPFLAYEIGERIDASGVLAVVVTGLILNYRAPLDLAPEVRLTVRATWSAIRYILEGSVFALIGLQLWAIVTAPDIRVGQLVVVCLAVLVTVILVRPAWILLIDTVTRLAGGRPALSSRRALLAVSWAGMRGVVSLAAAQTLPLDTPFRSLLLTCTIAVIVGTLVVQGLTLPAVIRALRLPGDRQADERRELDEAIEAANAAISARVEEVIADRQMSDRDADSMRSWLRVRTWRTSADDSDSAGATDNLRRIAGMAQWRHEMAAVERDVFISLRNAGRLSEEAMQNLEYRLDLEEALLDSRVDDANGHLDQLRADRPDRDDEPA